jgi:hypothetical protein
LRRRRICTYQCSVSNSYRQDDSDLGGLIPTSLASLTSLTYLSLATTGLSGMIPTRLASLASLTYLFLSSNGLSGPVFPAEFTALTALQQYDVQDNYLTGSSPTPAALEGMPNLQPVRRSLNLMLSFNLVDSVIDRGVWCYLSICVCGPTIL